MIHFFILVYFHLKEFLKSPPQKKRSQRSLHKSHLVVPLRTEGRVLFRCLPSKQNVTKIYRRHVLQWHARQGLPYNVTSSGCGSSEPIDPCYRSVQDCPSKSWRKRKMNVPAKQHRPNSIKVIRRIWNCFVLGRYILRHYTLPIMFSKVILIDRSSKKDFIDNTS